MKLILIMACILSICHSFYKPSIRRRNLSRNFSKIKDIVPKTSQQIKYDEFIQNPQIKLVVGNGPAGTGKTLLACSNAIKQFQSNKIDKIVITRPIISVEEDIGFLPGDINEKMNPWTIPIFDVFRDHYDTNELKYMIAENKIEIAPLGFMRGRTFKNSFIIADEMQNSSPTQMLMLLTRMGENSKMVITGDLNQSDIKNINGFQDLILKLEKKYQEDYFKMIKDQITVVNFKDADILRSKIVSKILEIYK
jgi:phosphate starvation-inducible PhoH-like protein